MEIYTLFHIQSNSFSISHVTTLTGTETEKQKKNNVVLPLRSFVLRRPPLRLPLPPLSQFTNSY